MMLLAGFQVFCARVANTLLTSWSPLTYERGDYSDGTEKLDPDYEPTCPLLAGEGEFMESLSDLITEEGWHRYSVAVKVDGPSVFWDDAQLVPDSSLPTSPSSTRQAGSPPPVGGEGPDGVVRHSPASTVGVPTLPMFKATDLQDIAIDYLANHFPWPDEGFIGCTCGKKDLTISEWCVHVSELQISELVFTLQGLVFDQSQQSQ